MRVFCSTLSFFAKHRVFCLTRIAYRVSIIFFSTATALVGSARGALPAAADSSSSALGDTSAQEMIRTYPAEEIIVTAIRLPQTASLSSSPVIILSRSEIEQMNSTSLADVLAPLSGLFVKDYGASSGLKTLSQRGLGPEHTLVLVNGMRVSNPQNALVDLGLFSSDEIDRIEFVRGGQSAGFGADAVAGLVNVVSSPLARRNPFEVSQSIGSFGSNRLSIGGGGTLAGSVAIRASFRQEKGRDDFPFIFRNGSEQFHLRRTNSDFIARSGTLQSQFLVTTNAELMLYARTLNSERGVGGPVAGPASSSVARQKDEDHLLQVTFRGDARQGARYRLGAQFHQAFERYRDEDFIVGAQSLNNFYKNREMRFEPGYEFEYAANSRLALGGEVATTTAEGNSLGSVVHRSAYGLYVSGQHQLAADDGWFKSFLLYPSLRYDRITTNEQVLSHWSPQLGIAVVVHDGTNALFPELRSTFRANLSSNFRVPTFNELYYAGGGGVGNPQLRPERSTSFDLGGDVSFLLAGRHALQCSYFTIAMNDRIVWVAAGGLSVTPKNIRRVRSTGVELSYRWSLFEEMLALGASYTSSSTKKVAEDFPGDPTVNTQLIYIPQETGNVSLSFLRSFDQMWLKQIGASIAVRYIGFRFTTEDNLRFLPSYALVDFNVRGRFAVFHSTLVARFDVNNLFNKEYHVIALYPMPMRSFRVTVGFEY